MERQKEIAILIAAGCTKSEAEKHLDRGTIVFEKSDFLKNKDLYLDGLSDEQKKVILDHVENNIGYSDYDVVFFDNEYYLIAYVL